MSPRRTPPQDASASPRSISPYSYQTRQASGSSKSKKREQFSACGACRMRRVRCDLKDLPLSGQQAVACSNCKERGLKCVDEFAEVKAVKLLRRGRRLQQAEAVYGKAPLELDSLRSVTPPPSVIPRLAPEFFDSAFFARFQVQRPILEPLEYRERYLQFVQGNTEVLPIPGQLIALILVVWAATFGVNEFGVEDAQDVFADARQRTDNINEMLQELLYLVDVHGILRKASWDGVRLLLLLLPLTQEIQLPLDRLIMYEATLSQVYNLCSLPSQPTVNSGQGEYVDALVRARLFWYAHITDGVTSGLRGGRILLSDYDLTMFEATLPSRQDGSRASDLYFFTFRCTSIPVRISSVCRTIHAALTGPLARRTDPVKEDLLDKAWLGLDRCWSELEELNNNHYGDMIDLEDLSRFIHGWQIFIFECHNVIREALKTKLSSTSSPPPHPSEDAALIQKQLVDLHAKAKARCHTTARDVVAIIRVNLGTAFFQYDASLVRDGCFYAALLSANEFDTQEEVETCLQAMREMRWVFSKSQDRTQSISMIWRSRVQQAQGQQGGLQTGTLPDPPLGMIGEDTAYTRRQPGKSLTIPPLTIPSGMSSRSSSAPSTALTQDGSWPSGSSSRTHSQPASLYNTSPITNRTSPYLGSPQLMNSKIPLPGSGGIMINSSIHGPSSLALERPDDGGYLHPYGYTTLGNDNPSHITLIPQTGTNAASLVLAPYHQMPYQDGITFGATHMDTTGESHMLSPVDDDESRLADPPKFF